MFRAIELPSLSSLSSAGVASGALALVLCAAACSSATKGSSAPTAGSGAETVWLEPSPSLAREINLHALEVEVMRTADDFTRLSDWFQSVGEPTYPKLLEMAGSDHSASRSFAMSVISAMGDPRLLEPFRSAVDFESLEETNHRYEYARALLAMSDYDGVPILIDGLEDTHDRKRALAYKALAGTIKNGLEFSPYGSEEVRRRQVARWRAWWAEVDGDSMLDRGDG